MGEWLVPDAVQCEETVQPYLNNSHIKDDDDRKHKTYRCMRDAGHRVSAVDEVRDHANPDMQCFVKGWA
jgi:hypothetical protein